MRSKAREIDIQPSDRVAFIHLPKTAGTTFNAIIEPLLSGLTFLRDPVEHTMSNYKFIHHLLKQDSLPIVSVTVDPENRIPGGWEFCCIG